MSFGDADLGLGVSIFGDNFVTKLLHNLFSKRAVRAKLMGGICVKEGVRQSKK